jgi:hypothetical protein
MEDNEIDSMEWEDLAKFLRRIKDMGARHNRVLQCGPNSSDYAT